MVLGVPARGYVSIQLIRGSDDFPNYYVKFSQIGGNGLVWGREGGPDPRNPREPPGPLGDPRGPPRDPSGTPGNPRKPQKMGVALLIKDYLKPGSDDLD